MEGELNRDTAVHHDSVEYRKGCPVCERSDPELERELQAFAQLLLDIYLAKRAKERQPKSGTGIDNAP